MKTGKLRGDRIVLSCPPQTPVLRTKAGASFPITIFSEGYFGRIKAEVLNLPAARRGIILTYGKARNLRVETFRSDEDNSVAKVAEWVNKWLDEHHDVEVVDIKFLFAIVPATSDEKGDVSTFPVWNHSVMIVYRKGA